MDGSRTVLFRDETTIDCLHFFSIMRSHNMVCRSKEHSCMFEGCTILKRDRAGCEAV